VVTAETVAGESAVVVAVIVETVVAGEADTAATARSSKRPSQTRKATKHRT